MIVTLVVADCARTRHPAPGSTARATASNTRNHLIVFIESSFVLWFICASAHTYKLLITGRGFGEGIGLPVALLPLPPSCGARARTPRQPTHYTRVMTTTMAR